MNNSIIVAEQNNVLVVDSRIIAEELGIKHNNFVALAQKHQSKIESRFGILLFQTEEYTSDNSVGRPERFILLNEGQAIALMTLSRNLDKVVDLKFDLVEAFQKAKASNQPIDQDLTRFETEADICFTRKDINKLLTIGYAKRDGKFVDPNLLLGFSAKQLALSLQSLMNLANKINEGIDQRAGIRQAIQQSKRLGFGKSKK